MQENIKQIISKNILPNSLKKDLILSEIKQYKELVINHFIQLENLTTNIKNREITKIISDFSEICCLYKLLNDDLAEEMRKITFLELSYIVFMITNII